MHASTRPLLASLWCLVAVALGRCGCDDPLNDLAPIVRVTPEVLDLGERRTGATSEAYFRIGNAGTAPLSVFRVEIEPAIDPPAGAADATGVAFSVVDVPREVAVQDSVEATLRFLPPVRGLFAGTLVVHTDDRATGPVRVPLVGEGGPPRIEASPSPLDFGVVNEGPGAIAQIILTNTGLDRLRIDEIRLRSAGADGGVAATGFSLLPDAPTSVGLDPGASVSVPVRVDPTPAIVAAAPDGVLRDALVVVSDAENAPLLEVPLQATPNLAPRAVAVELSTRRTEYKTGVGREVTIDGSETTDPEGEPVAFEWSLAERPAGSQAILGGTITGPTCTDTADLDACDVGQGFLCTDTGTRRCRQVMRARVTPDAVGEYVVRLKAVDARGAFSTADVRILPRDLALVLTWSTEANAACHQYSADECAAMSLAERQLSCCGQSDVDLHLLRPGGALGDYGECPVGCVEDVVVDGGAPQSINHCVEDGDLHADTCRQLGSDVAYANRHPEWGQVGRIDDPRLDVDDVRGEGPEVVSLDGPEDGTYTAVVHYCTDRIGEPTVARLQVYVKGVLVATAGPQLLDVEGRAWIAASLVRSGGPQDGQWQVVPSVNVFDESAPADLCRR